jgi:hypothetical protein
MFIFATETQINTDRLLLLCESVKPVATSYFHAYYQFVSVCLLKQKATQELSRWIAF